MRGFTASAGRNWSGELLDAAQAEPVRARRDGRDVAVILSVADYRRPTEDQPAAGPAAKALHAAIAKRFAETCDGLAEQCHPKEGRSTHEGRGGRPTVCPAPADILFIHGKQIRLFGGGEDVRDLGPAEGALPRPQTGCHADLTEEAAALWESLTVTHGFVDGNERVGFVCGDVFLGLDGHRREADPDKVAGFILERLETGSFTKDRPDARLRERVVADVEERVRQRRPSRAPRTRRAPLPRRYAATANRAPRHSFGDRPYMRLNSRLNCEGLL